MYDTFILLQVQQAQLEQQQQQQALATQQQALAQQQQFAYRQPSAGFANNAANQEAAQFAQAQTAKYHQQQADSNLLGVRFSPSNEVSHVKYSSGDLTYNF